MSQPPQDTLIEINDPSSTARLRAQGNTVIDAQDIELVDISEQRRMSREQQRRRSREEQELREMPEADDAKLNLFQRFMLRNKIRVYNLWYLCVWLFWSTGRFMYHQDRTKKTLNERNLFFGRTCESLIKATIAFLLLYIVLAALMTVALYCLSWGMFGNPQFDLNDRSWIPAGNPNSPHN